MAGTLLVSLDFELFWGMHDCATPESYGENIRGGREAIPRMLALFQTYGIHATWASVGMLFADSASEIKRYAPTLQPTYQNKALSPYPFLDTITDGDPHYFAPAILRTIEQTQGQEVGTHTFCHYYCREAGQTVEQFRADMQSAKAIAAAHGYNLQSVVLPRNQSEPPYTRVLQELGFTSYRDEENDWIHEKIHFRPLLRMLRLLDVYLPLSGHGCFSPKNENGILNLVGSRMYKPRFIGFLEPLKLRRIKKQMLYAAKHGLCFHLWWHPHNVGVHTEYHLKQLDEIFSYYQQLKQTYGMQSLNMGELAEKEL